MSMTMAMDVASGFTSSPLQKLSQQAQNGWLGDLLNFPMPHLNDIINGLDLGDDFRQPKPSSIAVLLLTWTLDGRTYVEGQKQAVAHFNNLTHVHVIKAEHNLFTSSPEVLNMMFQFLKGDRIEKLDISVEPTFIEHLK